jgi:cytoskeletal protein CcmA (bactofilin family)
MPNPPSPSPGPATPAVAPTRRFTDSIEAASTVIGPRTRVRGELVAEGPVEVAGTIEGDCRVRGLCRVRAGGSVTGDVTAASLVVEGEVTGQTLEADKVEIGATARVRANVRAPRVAIAEGGFLEGHVHMDEAGQPGEPVRFTEKRQPPIE